MRPVVVRFVVVVYVPHVVLGARKVSERVDPFTVREQLARVCVDEVG